MKQLAKYGLILAGICLGRLLPATAQDTSQVVSKDSARVIHIIQADKLNVVTKDSMQLNRFIGNAIFRQENTLFYCDSAFINRNDNVLDAYGHIHINQADSIHIYGDFLHYEGDTRMATLRDNARLTDGKVTLTGPEIEYDMNAKIGTYNEGGKLVNGSSTLTSRQGYYYADTKDVYFSENVLLVDPQYTLTTDTLLYNTQTRIATIIAPTTINDGKTIMYTTSGIYNTATGEGNFDSRPTIEDSTATITADKITMDKRTGLAYAIGNMIYTDTARKMSLLSNYGTVNQKEKSILATQHPLMIMEKDNDTLFVTSDTLYSSIFRKDTVAAPVDTIELNKKKMAQDSSLARIKKLRPKKPVDSSFARAMNKAVPDSEKPLVDTVLSNLWRNGSLVPPKDTPLLALHAADSVSLQLQNKQQLIYEALRLKDSLSGLAVTALKARDSLLSIAAIKKVKETFTDSLTAAATADVLKARDSLTAIMRNTSDSLLHKPADTTLKAFATPVATADTASNDTTEYRYFMAWHHVRIFSDSLQGVSDSLYYTSKDSVFRFFGNPVLWANNTQLSGDTIRMFTKNQQADKILLDQNALIVKEAGPKLYNQIKGIQITGYFVGQSIDWMHVDGNAESIYYIKDDDSAFVSVNKSLSGVINIYFRTGELHHITFIKDVEGTMYPFTQRPLEQMELENFHWDIKRKPKSKYELIGTSAEPPKEAPAAEKKEEEIP